jgi:putative glutamine amidotransferase
MSTKIRCLRIGIFDREGSPALEGRRRGPWPVGYTAAVTAAGGQPVLLGDAAVVSWERYLRRLDGLVIAGGHAAGLVRDAAGERLCERCRKHGLPVLGVDRGMHALNTAYGGSLYRDLPRELPEALQHRHPPESGLRHAITVARDTRLAQFYGEGEIVVNSEHRFAVSRVAHGFRVSARALDGVIEAIEAETSGWFAVGVQWHPASATASGLDIQLFRGLVEAARRRSRQPGRTAGVPAA